MLVNAVYSITDQIFIGHSAGLLGTAAIHVSFPVMMFAGAFAQLSGVGTAANFNLAMGAKQEERANGGHFGLHSVAGNGVKELQEYWLTCQLTSGILYLR